MKAAIWIRVSTDQQAASNQLPAIEQFCAHHGYPVTRRLELSDVSAYKGEHRDSLKELLDETTESIEERNAA